MKKKIALFLMCLFSLCFIFGGCSLIEKNLAKYYNTVVVSLDYTNGDKVEITKKELITAFNNYGANLVQSQGLSVEDALKKTIDALINQKVLLKEYDRLFAEENEKVQITNLDRNKLWKDTINALETNLETFAEEVRKDFNIVSPTAAEENSNETPVQYTPYTPKARIEFVDGQYVIKLIETKNENENEPLICNTIDYNEIINYLYLSILAKTEYITTNDPYTPADLNAFQDANVNKEALNRYVKQLLKNEEGQRLSTDDVSVFKREIQRIYDSRLDSLKISKMQEVIYYNSDISKITVEDVLNQYKGQIINSFTKYKFNSTKLTTDLLDNFSTVNYAQTEDFFFVSHILLKFNDQQTAAYNALEEKRKNGTISGSSTYYNDEIMKLVNAIPVKERDENGMLQDSSKTVEYVLSQINDAVSGGTDKQKAEAFRELLYKYNQDDGALNSEYLYVIGTQDSRMVEGFTNASRELFDDGNGKFGSVSGFVPSQYGVHIIFYAGKVKNNFPFEINSVDGLTFTNSDIMILNDTLLNPLTNKTLFDKVYESITLPQSSLNETLYLNTLKAKDKVTINRYTWTYDDLLGK